MDIDPLVPGFKFECQRCGACCQNIDRPLTLDELTYFNEHHLPVRWMVSKNASGEVVSIYPCKPRGDMCLACGPDNACLIYEDRPIGCRLYPFTFRVYYRKPPSYDEIVKSLGTVPPVGTIRHYIHKIDDQRWMFVGCPRTPVCPGIGAGAPWDQKKIKRFIGKNLYRFIRGRELMDETSQVLMSQFEPAKGDIGRLFVSEREEVVDDLTVVICKSRPQSPDPLFGNLMLTVPLSTTTAVPTGFK